MTPRTRTVITLMFATAALIALMEVMRVSPMRYTSSQIHTASVIGLVLIDVYVFARVFYFEERE